jgi:hypothetical protein
MIFLQLFTLRTLFRERLENMNVRRAVMPVVCLLAHRACRPLLIIAFSVLPLLLAPKAAWCQWSTGSGGAIYYNGGNVGIGTTNPQRNLNIVNSGPAGIQLYSTSGGSMGAWGMIAMSGGGFQLQNDATGTQTFSITAAGSFSFGGGNVGIGTTDPQNTLSVNGTIQAKSVLVNTGWSDYVFDPDYRLASLSELAAYVKENHHLPGIPSAAEVEEKGVSLGDMQAKLLAKIEELTLHMIQAEDNNNRLEQQNRELQNRVAALETHSREK